MGGLTLKMSVSFISNRISSSQLFSSGFIFLKIFFWPVTIRNRHFSHFLIRPHCQKCFSQSFRNCLFINYDKYFRYFLTFLTGKCKNSSFRYYKKSLSSSDLSKYYLLVLCSFVRGRLCYSGSIYWLFYGLIWHFQIILEFRRTGVDIYWLFKEIFFKKQLKYYKIQTQKLWFTNLRL